MVLLVNTKDPESETGSGLESVIQNLRNWIRNQKSN
jgi:hypothetical protein